jgi:Fe-S cluster assembly iron-binding protein IscA
MELSMLTISEDAATLIRRLTDVAAATDEAGLRIVVDSTHDSLSMDVVVAAEPLDVVVTSEGAKVFLSSSAAKRVTHGTLRAEITAGRSAFFLDR